MMEISKGGDNGEAKEEFEIPFARSLLGCKENMFLMKRSWTWVE